jgi:hypothetical protein
MGTGQKEQWLPKLEKQSSMICLAQAIICTD